MHDTDIELIKTLIAGHRMVTGSNTITREEHAWCVDCGESGPPGFKCRFLMLPQRLAARLLPSYEMVAASL